MSRCIGNEKYMILSSLAITWKMGGKKKRSLKGQCLLYLRKAEVKFWVKAYNKARYVPTANMSSCVGQMQLGQRSLSIYTSGPQL
jgi:hypothetical protein